MATKKKMLQAAAGNAGGGGPLNVEDVFSTYLWKGTSATQTITNGIDLDGEGGLVWAKSRNNSYKHSLYDTERGTTKNLSTNSTDAEVVETGVTSFNSSGFNVGSWAGINDSGDDVASWTFRKVPKFFDCVTWTGTGSPQNISHSLGSVPGMILTCNTGSAADWGVYHRQLNNGTDRGHWRIKFNSTGAQVNQSNFWNDTAPTDSVFTVGTNASTNDTDNTYVAYLFAHNDGDGEFGPDGDADIIKCGSYTGDGTTDGSKLVDLGFEPQFLIIKNASVQENWLMIDSMRGASYDNTNVLFSNLSQAESESGRAIWTMDPNGFRLSKNNSDSNQSGNNYIYMAIRRGTKVPESATEVFAIDTGTGTIPTYVSGFPVDMSINRQPSVTADNRTGTRLTGNNRLVTNSTAAQASDNAFVYDYMDGWSESYADSTHYSWMWKRAPGYFDAVAYTSTATSGNPQTESHNLGVVPEMMWVKCRSTAKDWQVYHADLGVSKKLILNSSSAELSAGVGAWNTAPTDTSFTVGDDSEFGGGGRTYIAYLFASLDGVSKVGSYTGNGTSQTIDCGFTSGARFLLIKNTEQGRGWVTIDTERGLASGDDKVLYLNADNAQMDLDYVDPHSSGFTLSTSNDQVNANGRLYIFYAIA